MLPPSPAVTLARIFIVVLSLACFLGCSTTQVMTRPQPATAQGELKEGDKVMIDLVDGRRVYAVVQRITEEALVTSSGTFAWSEIREIQVDRISWKKTTVLVLGALVVLAAWVIYEVSHMDIRIQ